MSKKQASEKLETAALADIPHVYLLERGHWSDFKRALNDCGLSWNLPDWMTTIVYKGVEWDSIVAQGMNLNEVFPVTEKKSAGDGQASKTSKLSAQLIGMLKLPTNLSEYIQPTLQFCNLRTVEYEPDKKLPARQKLWSWMVKSLQGKQVNPGPYYYLVQEVQPYDISFLFKRLCQVLEQVTICSLDDELECVITTTFKPQSQNIFSYLAELRKAVKRLHDLNERIPKKGQIWIPDSFIRSRLIRAARQVPVYKPVLDALLISPIEKWSTMTVDELYHSLEQVQANDLSTESISSSRTLQQSTQDGVHANVVQQKNASSKNNSKGKTCHEFARSASCSRPNCPYIHQAAKPEEKVSEKSNPSRQPPRVCDKCGDEAHIAKDCKYSGKCGWCSKEGHKENMCRSKKIGKPQVFYSHVNGDGAEIKANLIIIDDSQWPVGYLNPKAQSEAPLKQETTLISTMPISEAPTKTQGVFSTVQPVEGPLTQAPTSPVLVPDSTNSDELCLAFLALFIAQNSNFTLRAHVSTCDQKLPISDSPVTFQKILPSPLSEEFLFDGPETLLPQEYSIQGSLVEESKNLCSEKNGDHSQFTLTENLSLAYFLFFISLFFSLMEGLYENLKFLGLKIFPILLLLWWARPSLLSIFISQVPDYFISKFFLTKTLREKIGYFKTYFVEKIFSKAIIFKPECGDLNPSVLGPLSQLETCIPLSKYFFSSYENFLWCARIFPVSFKIEVPCLHEILRRCYSRRLFNNEEKFFSFFPVLESEKIVFVIFYDVPRTPTLFFKIFVIKKFFKQNFEKKNFMSVLNLITEYYFSPSKVFFQNFFLGQQQILICFVVTPSVIPEVKFSPLCQ
jgi:hypothetical protein